MNEVETAKQRIEDLENALYSIIRRWENPGPMGILYEMPREVSYAKSVLDGAPGAP